MLRSSITCSISRTDAQQHSAQRSKHTQTQHHRRRRRRQSRFCRRVSAAAAGRRHHHKTLWARPSTHATAHVCIYNQYYKRGSCSLAPRSGALVFANKISFLLARPCARLCASVVCVWSGTAQPARLQVAARCRVAHRLSQPSVVRANATRSKSNRIPYILYARVVAP